MWGRTGTPRNLLLTASLGGFLLGLLLVSSPSPSSTPSSASVVQCPVNQHHLSALACSVPVGPTFDPCSIVTVGVTSCPFHLPDFNPVDWLTWFECTVVADAALIWSAIVNGVSNFAATIWNAVSGAVSNFVGSVATGVLNVLLGFVNTIVNAVQSAVTGFLAGVQQTVNGVGQWLSQVSAGAGPLAPLVAVTLAAGLIVAGFLMLYFAVIFGIAGAKTLFNLL